MWALNNDILCEIDQYAKDEDDSWCMSYSSRDDTTVSTMNCSVKSSDVDARWKSYPQHPSALSSIRLSLNETNSMGKSGQETTAVRGENSHRFVNESRWESNPQNSSSRRSSLNDNSTMYIGEPCRCPDMEELSSPPSIPRRLGSIDDFQKTITQPPSIPRRNISIPNIDELE